MRRLIGPHRDDYAFASGERELATFASRGQQRTAILALKLAQLDLLTPWPGGHPCCFSTTSSLSWTRTVAPTWCGVSVSCRRPS